MAIIRAPNNNPRHREHNRILRELVRMLSEKYEILATAHVLNPDGGNVVPIVMEGAERDIIFKHKDRVVMIRVDTRKLSAEKRRRKPGRSSEDENKR